MKFLVVAPWGNPSMWRRARYRIELRHKALEGLGEGEVETCSSTKALAELLRRRGDVKVLIFGLDTVAQPAGGRTPREIAEEKYREWARALGVEGEVVSLPGIGLFHGWRYEGKPLHLFNAAFYHILKTAEELKPSFIVVDLTHGVNYQTIAVLYAAVAASVLLEKEDRLLLYNSEPYPAEYSAETCIKEAQRVERREGVPQLTALDVRQLQDAVGAIRLLWALRRLAPLKIDVEIQSPELRRRFDKVITSYRLLASGAAALLFPKAKFSGRAPEFYVPGEGPGAVPEPRIDIKVDPDRRVVSYGEADEMYSVAVALHYLERALDELRAEDLVSFLNRVAKHYKEIGVTLTSIVVDTTAKQLGRMVKAAEALADKGVLKRIDGVIELSQLEAMVLFERSNRALELAASWRQALDEFAKVLSGEMERKISDRTLRNLLAHGGYSHVAVEKVVIKDKKIVEVVYNGEIVSELVQRLKTN
ncbi:hypothetical protein PAE0117 [Pyrobaculum aerophilum str. IM2]|uniref:CRISPR system endoribonuclease Csx1 CARF domain-containing protein n=2 Tax=Pyrobaculum aerophilum TaxID=13773 RepID=Q8ZZR7_PYRAE|nr:CRISPR-associated CARF protein Csx1 [Pyrobaculum aerophilum]AAL62572.1 hypothetical protein PAE0117 [Pyrobaculum aerophilum str. IM2]HII46808.1 TIGR01897 family CRISPR-associated protein [Pyrobaculum aerophilum]